ncbi:leucyl aminopeptidase [Rhizomicrobium palustre]|uniref:Probable cytosol aminopeptidase n=1 Tax=Rhizomicrobium palustre TaxID=189966 RepID=A0A846MUW3_9PROT|nr:leucyl aminopeptidase [Rhizomicrobium palustre]NIK87019.1 leucyl aminopeptidase [Rhizomicrobium palustre]
MHFTFAAVTAATQGTLVVGASEGPALLGAAAKADKASKGAVQKALAASRFTGKSGQLVDILAPAGLSVTRLIVLGLGKAEEFDGAAAELAGAAVVAKLKGGADTAVTVDFEGLKGAKVSGAELAAHIALGAQLKSYSFEHYRTKDKEEGPKLGKMTVVTGDVAAARKAFARLDAVASGVFLARDLVNEPPNVLSPVEFGRRAKELTKLGVKVSVLGEAQMKRLGMNALLGVGQGSERESQLVVMEWKGSRKKTAAPIAFVGKGVCFDSGGLSLKPGAGMMGMKGDMGGAAAVIGTMKALATRKAKVNAVGVIGLVENMPDGKAQRPDDVVKSMSGQTIEVLNTDAEGRLVLADALWFTQDKFAPKFVIDLATLTGAILISLGAEHAGLFSNDDALAGQIAEAGKAVGEPVWRMPLAKGYDKLIRSKIADMKNIGGQHAGSITAAQFLQRFVKEKTPWAHLDIAGVAWQDGEQKPLIPSWGTGWGVRVLDRLVADKYED